jgi:hypothetical protein
MIIIKLIINGYVQIHLQLLEMYITFFLINLKPTVIKNMLCSIVYLNIYIASMSAQECE